MSEVQRSCVWATHHRSNNNKNDDILVIKERVKDPNGVERPNLRIIENFKRPYWITKKSCRNHKDKKDWEYLENLDQYECTQAELAVHSAKNLGMFVKGNYARQGDVNQSPYIYGTDVTSPVIVKNMYRKKWPDYLPKSTVAILDYETDVLNNPDDKRVITGAVTFGDKVHIAVTRAFIADVADPDKKIREAADKYLQKYMIDRKIKLRIDIVEKPIDVIKSCMRTAHLLKPDYLAIWNMVFDVNVMIDECNREGIDPADIFCDPSIPRQYRSFRWVEKPKIKKKSNGDTMSKDPSELWHQVDAPASFYIVDAMCFYRISRVMEGKLNSYSLDAILNKELDLGKLRFKEADKYKGLDWHIYMQRNYKVEYCIYNIFDCIGMELLDEKTGDLAIAIGPYVGISELKDLSSNPKRLADACHFFLLEQGKVICSTSSDMTHEFDKHVIGLNDWIITLPSELVEKTGRSLVEGIDDIESRFSAHNGDIDVASGYPSAGTSMNVANGTTMAEVVEIDGKSEQLRRRNGVDMMACRVNGSQIARELFGMPRIVDIEEILNKVA